MRRSLAPTTQVTYKSAVRNYKEYCRSRRWLEDEPITAYRLGEWLAALADGGQQSSGTLQVYRAALRRQYTLEAGPGCGAANPADSEYLRMIVQGIVKDKAEHEQAKRASAVKSDPATPDIIMNLASRHAVRQTASNPKLVMLYAALCLGTCALLRPNELLGAPKNEDRAIKRDQITFKDAEGLPCSPGCQTGQSAPDTFILTLPVSKTDQARRGKTRTVAAAFAVRAVAQWCAHWDEQPAEEKARDARLFRVGDKGLRTQQLLAHLTAQCVAVGMTNFKFTGKCFRRGGASAMAAAGEQPADIKKAGGWKGSSYLKYLTAEAAERHATAASRRLERGVTKE